MILFFGLFALGGAARAAPCAESERSVDTTAALSGWGVDARNLRFISEQRAEISPDNIERLQLQWAFALPDTDAPRFMPLLTPDTVVITDAPGMVYGLDRYSGCEKWRFDAGAMVRTALTHIRVGGLDLVLLGTMTGELLALRLGNGELHWSSMVGDHERAMLSGSPVFHDGVIYQPVSSWEVFWAGNPFYACCTFRGSVVAVDAVDGKIIWRGHTIAEEATVQIERWLLPDHLGPSGAPVWSQPTLDIARGRVYVGTGENYSAPPTDTSDAILAFDMKSGELLWRWQSTRGDAWNIACITKYHINCPPDHGEDLDFGAPPILATVGGDDFILAGQKSGRVFALDPDNHGELLWTAVAGAGGKAGGVHFGMAVNPQRNALYVPISDRPVGDMLGNSHDGTPDPSLHALDIATGKTLWRTAAPGDCTARAPGGAVTPIEDCFAGFSAAVTVTDNIVYAPTLDGVLRAFHADDGRQLWSWDTLGRHPAVNGGHAEGGAIDLGGVFVDGGQLFVSSGYGQFGQMPGNAFLVFGLDTARETAQ